MEIQESQVSKLVATHGTCVEMFAGEWESEDVLGCRWLLDRASAGIHL
jgi:hypothetical protein